MGLGPSFNTVAILRARQYNFENLPVFDKIHEPCPVLKFQNLDYIFLSSNLSNNVLMMSSGLCKPYLVTLLPL